jgi:hypothetical protein
MDDSRQRHRQSLLGTRGFRYGPRDNHRHYLYSDYDFANPPQPVNPSTNIAVLEIACVLTGNIFAMVVGILSLVFYNDQIVRDYFARLNGTAPLIPALAVPPSPPAPVVDSKPVVNEESASTSDSTIPAPEPPESTENS